MWKPEGGKAISSEWLVDPQLRGRRRLRISG
jgi:hypothetical protein